MAKKESCATCRFGKEKGPMNYDRKTCKCRRFPPAQAGDQQIPDPCPYPVVLATNWCGEYKS